MIMLCVNRTFLFTLLSLGSITYQQCNLLDQFTKMLIVDTHNDFRTKVDPAASDMLRMQWNEAAASKAQILAEQCDTVNLNETEDREVGNYGVCGYSSYTSKSVVRWSTVLNAWFEKKHFFQYDRLSNDPFKVGEYTQMVWATSHQVGCGFALCTNIFYKYVCLYCPRGNFQFSRPYKKGEPCLSCPDSCHNNNMCTNACPYGNLSDKCEGTDKHPDLCTGVSKEAERASSQCKATCICGRTGQIYEKGT